MSEEFINDYGKNLYYFNQLKDQNLLCFRVAGRLKCNRIVSGNSKDDEQLITEEFEKITDDLYKLKFYIENENYILSKNSVITPNGVNSVEKSCNHLFESYFKEKKVSSKLSIDDVLRNFIPVQILKSATVADTSEIESPIFTNHKGISQLQIYEIPIDLLVLVNQTLKINELYFIIFERLQQHLEIIKQCYLTFYKNEKTFIPETYHYWHSDRPELILTIAYPNNKDDADLRIVRENIHKALQLPLNMPYFRRVDAFKFTKAAADDSINASYLENPHVHVKPSGLQGGKQTLVKGNYIYFHYLQDGFDDNGWGCAYRSFQTIFSWYKLQSYTNEPIPTHRQIQQTLCDIGDKKRSFVGSTEWIGSMEISFCLNKLLGVDSKILNVSKGSELGEKVRELEYHFETEGTPVMIGGGAYAYTILGVDFNENTGEVKYLVLDPHYVGPDEIKTVTNKGWCAWKASTFWNEKSYYNLCLPQRSNII